MEKETDIKMELDKISNAIVDIIDAVGENKNREGLKETPARISRMYEEIFRGLSEDPKEHLSKRFKVDNNEMVLVKDIPFYSMCEHHFLPFFGQVHVAYIPNGEVVGLSKIARTTDVFAKRPQIQENMTKQIADAIMDNLMPQGVMVLIEAEHLCMSMRGVNKPGSKTVSIATRGVFSSDDKLQDRFMKMIK